MKKLGKVLLGILLGIIIVMLLAAPVIHLYNAEKQTRILEAELRLYKDSLRITERGYQKKIIEIQDANDVLNIQTRDSLFNQMQKAFSEFRKELKKDGSSVTSFSTTSIHTIEKPTVIIHGDTTKREYPTYVSNHSDEWRTLEVVANKDSVKTNLKVRDKYNVVLGYESNGLFKKSTPTVFLQSLSPYSEVKDVQVSRVTGNPSPKISLGYHIGFGAQYGLIHKQLDFGPQVGVSINVKF